MDEKMGFREVVWFNPKHIITTISISGLVVEFLPAMQEAWVWSPANARTLMFRVSLMAETVKNLPAIQEIQVQSLGWEDLLEKGMATHSSILAWRIPWTEEPGRLQSMESQSQTRLSKYYTITAQTQIF